MNKPCQTSVRVGLPKEEQKQEKEQDQGGHYYNGVDGETCSSSRYAVLIELFTALVLATGGDGQDLDLDHNHYDYDDDDDGDDEGDEGDEGDDGEDAGMLDAPTTPASVPNKSMSPSYSNNKSGTSVGGGYQIQRRLPLSMLLLLTQELGFISMTLQALRKIVKRTRMQVCQHQQYQEYPHCQQQCYHQQQQHHHQQQQQQQQQQQERQHHKHQQQQQQQQQQRGGRAVVCRSAGGYDDEVADDGASLALLPLTIGVTLEEFNFVYIHMTKVLMHGRVNRSVAV
jgi:hypothetical protein